MTNFWGAFTESSPSRRTAAVLALLAGIVLTGLIGAWINRYFARSKPHIELVSIQFRGTSLPGQKVHPGGALMQTYSDIPYSIDSFSDSMTFEELQTSIDDVRGYTVVLPIAQKALDDIIKLLQASPRDAAKDKLRLRLLQKWVPPPGDSLTKTLQSVIQQRGYFKKLLGPEDSKYRTHPEEERWKSPETARIMVSQFSGVDLAEEVIRPDDVGRVVAAKTMANLEKRLWIYLERDMLLELFGHVKETLAAANSMANDFLNLLVELQTTSDPDRINTSVLVSNLGDRPVICRNIGVLQIRTSKTTLDVPMRARTGDSIPDSDAVLIPGNGTIRVEFYSRDTLEDVSTKSFPGTTDTLQTLFDSEVLKCTFAMYHIPASGSNALLRTEGEATFGKSISSELIDALLDSVAE